MLHICYMTPDKCVTSAFHYMSHIINKADVICSGQQQQLSLPLLPEALRVSKTLSIFQASSFLSTYEQPSCRVPPVHGQPAIPPQSSFQQQWPCVTANYTQPTTTTTFSLSWGNPIIHRLYIHTAYAPRDGLRVPYLAWHGAKGRDREG